MEVTLYLNWGAEATKRWARVALAVIVALLVILLIGPFLILVSPLEGTVPLQQLADPDSRFIDINGLRVHYKIAGQGEPNSPRGMPGTVLAGSDGLSVEAG